MSLKHSLLPALLLLSACAQTPRQDPAEIPLPVPQTQADVDEYLQRAAGLRSQASDLRDQAESRYDSEDAACFKRILVNACRDSVRVRYVEQLDQAREYEIEASRLSRAARQRQLVLTPTREAPVAGEGAQLLPVTPTTKTMPAPAGKARSATEIRTPPPAAPTPEAKARAQTEREQRAQRAEERKQREAEAAAERARRARTDAERYAEREARRKAEESGAEASAPR
ncbi:MAG: hypothetical protein CGU28_01280 [Candidatus Dactylopiibacterium carminicum]|uniref:DUF4398 domain-containing protein n=1 Tax=Candidatus Dactylopiibacterium carminicum TaxID=857335 RepID=A0A272EW15_9RHOO|nr:hypothetical protein [Candidatus Dactylopiibacterium carminicum]KAF7599507.1 hypothetical protein BGI27_07480 [Candidatus Dactylopiibacterium carminicum]PAS94299.1 MAG: hypothetical protein CGU29_04630 [Candidatus Dactylopiibacterium carminicum]PAS98493.1 MAG: hypothetical protein CGU28_01280 [Candidatus Dactylopiibacterium carminicum]PAS99513.1 MAG: hypothetical protein BSR46_07505 [Candidatus Dactylopiibacterium carminicum]